MLKQRSNYRVNLFAMSVFTFTHCLLLFVGDEPHLNFVMIAVILLFWYCKYTL